MLGPTPKKDAVVDKQGKLTRIWDVFLTNVQQLIDFGEPISRTLEITATDGIGFRNNFDQLRIVSATSGNTTITANPQIKEGFDGQIGKLIGTNNTRTVTIANGNGLVLKGSSPLIIAEDIVIQFHYNKSRNVWIEDFRNN